MTKYMLKMRRAQYSVVYLLIISGILLFLMGAIFLMMNSFQQTVVERFGNELISGITAKIENALIELKTLSRNAQEIKLDVYIPEHIGDQRYFVTANGRTVEIRTYGNPSFVRQINMTFWNATLRGAVFSARGIIHMAYEPQNNTVTFE